jgi:hypothetical protein
MKYARQGATLGGSHHAIWLASGNLIAGVRVAFVRLT